MAGSQTISRILVPFDFEAPSYRALEFAKVVGEKFGATVELLHTVPGVYAADPSMPVPEVMGFSVPEGYLEAAMKEAKGRLDHVAAGVDTQSFRVEPRVTTGDPRAEIIRRAAETHVDVIVMGTHGRHGLDRVILGSVTDRVMRTATCPVVTVR